MIFDDAMTERNRSTNGSLIENASKFPSGLQSIADRLHADGLYFGVYSSAGRFSKSLMRPEDVVSGGRSYTELWIEELLPGYFCVAEQ